MTILLPLLIAAALGLLLLYVRMEQRRRRREMGLRELTPDLRDLRYHDLKRLRDFDEALQLDDDAPAWGQTRFYNRRSPTK